MRLPELIEHHKRRLNLSYPAMETRARSAGFDVTRQTFQHLVKGQWRNPPQRDTVEALAIVLELEPVVVWDAVIASMGVTRAVVGVSDSDPDTSAIVLMLGDRSPEQRAALRRVLQTWAVGDGRAGEANGSNR